MKIALAQLNYHIGNFEGNFNKIIENVERARNLGADLIVFGELAICGYPPRDFLEFEDFIERCQETLLKLAAFSKGIGIIVGAPSVNPEKDGKDHFNSAYLLHDGKILDVVHKALLPTYDIFDEYRYFEPYKNFHTILFQGKRIALTICEDIWNIHNENPLYKICPMDEMIDEGPDLLINISASPFDYTHAEERLKIVKANALRYKIPVFYVNHVGAQTEIIFDGGSIVMGRDGILYEELSYFEECLSVYDLEDVENKRRNSSRPHEQIKQKESLIHDALVVGVRNYFDKLGFRKAILGHSGGIDSAVTLVLAARALGPENVRGILMPSEFSTDHSLSDAIELSKNLGTPFDIIPINNPYNSFLDLLQPYFDNLPFNVTEENIQARSRAVILMALSNKHGYILLNTSNKSEAAVGYGTLYGDMCGGLSVIGDVYKTEVYELAEYINKDGIVIPQNIIDKAPSAELRPDQKDSDSLPDYALLDKILFQYIEKRKGPDDIISMGFDPAIVKRALKLVNINEYKRYQTPPMLRVSPKAFGMGRRMPIVAKYLS